MDYYKLISEAIMEGEASETMQYTKEALGLKYPPENILKNGLMAGINTIAEKFKDEAVLIPEVLMSTRALHAGLKVLQPYLEVKGKKGAIKIVIGTVYGDLHDVGKNIIKALLTTMNVEVIDLGIDVSVENFIQAIEKARYTYDVIIIDNNNESNAVGNRRIKKKEIKGRYNYIYRWRSNSRYI